MHASNQLNEVCLSVKMSLIWGVGREGVMIDW
jgi:hypothetical protein